jgi:hypothetical protein
MVLEQGNSGDGPVEQENSGAQRNSGIPQPRAREQHSGVHCKPTSYIETSLSVVSLWLQNSVVFLFNLYVPDSPSNLLFSKFWLHKWLLMLCKF